MFKNTETEVSKNITLVFTREYDENMSPVCNCGSGQPVATCQDERGFCG